MILDVMLSLNYQLLSHSHLAFWLDYLQFLYIGKQWSGQGTGRLQLDICYANIWLQRKPQNTGHGPQRPS